MTIEDELNEISSVFNSIEIENWDEGNDGSPWHKVTAKGKYIGYISETDANKWCVMDLNYEHEDFYDFFQAISKLIQTWRRINLENRRNLEIYKMTKQHPINVNQTKLVTFNGVKIGMISFFKTKAFAYDFLGNRLDFEGVKRLKDYPAGADEWILTQYLNFVDLNMGERK